MKAKQIRKLRKKIQGYNKYRVFIPNRYVDEQTMLGKNMVHAINRCMHRLYLRSKEYPESCVEIESDFCGDYLEVVHRPFRNEIRVIDKNEICHYFI